MFEKDALEIFECVRVKTLGLKKPAMPFKYRIWLYDGDFWDVSPE